MDTHGVHKLLYYAVKRTLSSVKQAGFETDELIPKMEEKRIRKGGSNFDFLSRKDQLSWFFNLGYNPRSPLGNIALK